MRGGTKASSGFTIAELMIVLAVSGILFVTAARAVSGQFARTEYNQAVRDLETTIIDIANDVSTGYSFNRGDNRVCTANSVTGYVTFGARTADSQGTNKTCIFIGKAVQFNRDGTLDIYTLAGNSKVAGTDVDVTSINQVFPATHADLRETRKLLNGLVPDRFSANSSAWNTGIGSPPPGLTYVRDSDPTIGGSSTVIFMTTFGLDGGSGPVAGSPITQLYALNGAKNTSTRTEIVDLLNNTATYNTTNAYIPITTGFSLCVRKSGKATELSLGANGQRLTTRMKVGEPTCDL